MVMICCDSPAMQFSPIRTNLHQQRCALLAGLLLPSHDIRCRRSMCHSRDMEFDPVLPPQQEGL